MQFCEKLNEYMNQLNINAKELSDESGLSPSVISRYKSGKRIPSENSEQISMLAKGIANISRAKGNDSVAYDNVYNSLLKCIDNSSGYTRHQASNLNTLIEALKINTKDMARVINYDPSYISRVRSRQRIPSNSESFILKISNYVASTYTSEKDIQVMSQCLGCPEEKLETIGLRQVMLEQWLSEKTIETDTSPIQQFLAEVDEFNLDDYMRRIHFDDIKVPTVPISLPVSKNYYGVRAMKQAELEFIKTTVLSRSRKPVYMYSDMPMEDMGQDESFKKKYILGLGMMIRKGLTLNVIHNLNRPFEEIMMGLSGWIPLYMTGQISPYYFDRIANPVFSQLNNVSGAAALDGQCVGENHQNGKYYFTNNKREVEYYRKRAEDMINSASPLMNIYRLEQAEDFRRLWNNSIRENGTYTRTGYSLPIFTIPQELLEQMLLRHRINDADRNTLILSINDYKKQLSRLLETNTLSDIAFDIPDKEFEEHPPCLSLSFLFFGHNITYTQEEYRKHLEATIDYANNNANYSFRLSGNYDFRNIQITSNHKNWIMVSKDQSPAIHFVIRHPLLRDAIEKLIISTLILPLRS